MALSRAYHKHRCTPYISPNKRGVLSGSTNRFPPCATALHVAERSNRLRTSATAETLAFRPRWCSLAPGRATRVLPAEAIRGMEGVFTAQRPVVHPSHIKHLSLLRSHIRASAPNVGRPGHRVREQPRRSYARLADSGLVNTTSTHLEGAGRQRFANALTTSARNVELRSRRSARITTLTTFSRVRSVVGIHLLTEDCYA